MKTKQKINLRVLYSKNTAIIAAFSGNFSSGINPKFGRSDSTSIADLLLYCGSWVITYSTSWKYTKYVHRWNSFYYNGEELLSNYYIWMYIQEYEKHILNGVHSNLEIYVKKASLPIPIYIHLHSINQVSMYIFFKRSYQKMFLTRVCVGLNLNTVFIQNYLPWLLWQIDSRYTYSIYKTKAPTNPI